MKRLNADLVAAILLGSLLLGCAYFFTNYHAVYSKECRITPDGESCPLDHYEKNK